VNNSEFRDDRTRPGGFTSAIRPLTSAIGPDLWPRSPHPGRTLPFGNPW